MLNETTYTELAKQMRRASQAGRERLIEACVNGTIFGLQYKPYGTSNCKEVCVLSNLFFDKINLKHYTVDNFEATALESTVLHVVPGQTKDNNWTVAALHEAACRINQNINEGNEIYDDISLYFRSLDQDSRWSTEHQAVYLDYARRNRRTQSIRRLASQKELPQTVGLR